MKALLEKDRNLRLKLAEIENKHFIFKSIVKNLNLFILIRWNAFLRLNLLSKSKVSITNRCLYSYNKKRFNKLTGFSRNVFLKKIRAGEINGLRKSSW